MSIKAGWCAGCIDLGEAMMFATTPHMFAEGVEASKYGQMCAKVKRTIYGCDCYAYALVCPRCAILVVDAVAAAGLDTARAAAVCSQ